MGGVEATLALGALGMTVYFVVRGLAEAQARAQERALRRQWAQGEARRWRGGLASKDPDERARAREALEDLERVARGEISPEGFLRLYGPEGGLPPRGVPLGGRPPGVPGLPGPNGDRPLGAPRSGPNGDRPPTARTPDAVVYPNRLVVDGVDIPLQHADWRAAVEALRLVPAGTVLMLAVEGGSWLAGEEPAPAEVAAQVQAAAELAAGRGVRLVSGRRP